MCTRTPLNAIIYKLNTAWIFTKKPMSEKKRILTFHLNHLTSFFFLIRPFIFNIQCSYIPDSQVSFDKHSEYKSLFKNFSRSVRTHHGGDMSRLWSFILNVKQIQEEGIAGDYAELGVFRGNTASVLASYAKVFNKSVYLFDTFEGFKSKDLKGIDQHVEESSFSNTSLDLVKSNIGSAASVCRFIQGHFPSSLTNEHKNLKFSLVSLDCDLYDPMKAGLEYFYPRMSNGGIFLLHDYSSYFWAGAKLAIDEFCKLHGEYIILMPDKSGSAFFRKSK
jgi:hypothetical protein